MSSIDVSIVPKMDSMPEDLNDIDIDFNDFEGNDENFAEVFDQLIHYNDNNVSEDDNEISQQLMIDLINNTFDENNLKDILEIIDRDQSQSATTSSANNNQSDENSKDNKKNGKKSKRKRKPIINKGKCLRKLYEEMKIKVTKRKVDRVLTEEELNNGVQTRNQIKKQIEKENEKKNFDKIANNRKVIQLVLDKIDVKENIKSLNIRKDIEFMYKSIGNGFKCNFCQFANKSFNRSVIENHIKVKHWEISINEIKTEVLNKLRKRITEKINNINVNKGSNSSFNNNKNNNKNQRNNNSEEKVSNRVNNNNNKKINDKKSAKASDEKRLTDYLNRRMRNASNRVFNFNGITIIITHCPTSSIGPKFDVSKKKRSAKIVSKCG